jgi:phage gpG-like protein
MSVEIKLTGSKQVQNKLRQLIKSVRNTSVVNRKVSVWLLKWVNDNFKSQGRKVSSSGWKKLKAGGRWVSAGGGWLKWDPSAKILQDTGVLRASFAIGRFYTRNSAGIGSDVSYSKYHQFGVPSRNLPKRRMLPMNTDSSVNKGVLKIYNMHIEKELRR